MWEDNVVGGGVGEEGGDDGGKEDDDEERIEDVMIEEISVGGDEDIDWEDEDGDSGGWVG